MKKTWKIIIGVIVALLIIGMLFPDSNEDSVQDDGLKSDIMETKSSEIDTDAPETDSPETKALESTGKQITYVLSMNTKKFHYLYCRWVKSIKPENYDEFIGDRSELVADGYDPCGTCHP